MPTETTREERDLLIRVETKLDLLTTTVSEIKAAVGEKADAHRVGKLEDRLEKTERKVYAMCGGLAVVEVLLKMLHH
jgi:hypothetical protein